MIKYKVRQMAKRLLQHHYYRPMLLMDFLIQYKMMPTVELLHNNVQHIAYTSLFSDFLMDFISTKTSETLNCINTGKKQSKECPIVQYKTIDITVKERLNHHLC